MGIGNLDVWSGRLCKNTDVQIPDVHFWSEPGFCAFVNEMKSGIWSAGKTWEELPASVGDCIKTWSSYRLAMSIPTWHGCNTQVVQSWFALDKHVLMFSTLQHIWNKRKRWSWTRLPTVFASGTCKAFWRDTFDIAPRRRRPRECSCVSSVRCPSAP